MDQSEQRYLDEGEIEKGFALICVSGLCSAGGRVGRGMFSSLQLTALLASPLGCTVYMCSILYMLKNALRPYITLS